VRVGRRVSGRVNFMLRRPGHELASYVVAWATTVFACDRERAARMALQELLIGESIGVAVVKAELVRYAGPANVLVNKPCLQFGLPMMPGPPPLRRWHVAWSKTQTALDPVQAGEFALRNQLASGELEFVVADDTLSDRRIVTLTKQTGVPL